VAAFRGTSAAPQLLRIALSVQSELPSGCWKRKCVAGDIPETPKESEAQRQPSSALHLQLSRRCWGSTYIETCALRKWSNRSVGIGKPTLQRLSRSLRQRNRGLVVVYIWY
jgi:hypothetical protein